jgi:hypothetical protein
MVVLDGNFADYSLNFSKFDTVSAANIFNTWSKNESVL